MNRFLKPAPFAAALLLALAAGRVSAMMPSEALRLAVERDPSLAAAQALFAAESETGEQERAGLRPSLSLSGEGSYNASNSKFAFGSAKDQYPAWSASLNARQPVLRFDWSARGERADARDALAREGLDDRTQQFVARVAQRYLDTLLAEDELEQAEAEASAVRESLGDTRKRYDVQLVPGTDLREAEARDDLAQAQLVSARAQVEQVRDALQEITGYDRSPLPHIREKMKFPPLEPGDLDSWLRLANERSKAANQAKLQVQVARTTLESRRAEALPAVDLVARAGRNDSTEFVLGQRQDDASIGLELNVPIYAGGYNNSRVREAEAKLREAEAELQRVTLESERSVRSVYRAVQTARLRSEAYDHALSSALLAQTAAQAGYDAGTRTITDVLDAKSRVVQARRTRNAARYDLLTQVILLNATAGTLDAAVLARGDALFEPR